MKRMPIALILFLSLTAPAAQAGAAALESFRGDVAVRALEKAVVVALDESGDGVADRLFVADLGYGLGVGLPEGRFAAGQILTWPSHLVVVSPGAGEALHLAVAGDVSEPRRELQAALGAAGGRLRGRPSVDAILEERYRLSRIEAERGLASRWGAMDRLGLDEVVAADAADLEARLFEMGFSMGSRLFLTDEQLGREMDASLKTIYYQDPGGGGGGSASCGAACNITCGDGSFCNIGCAGALCASCTCPATCICR